MLALPTSEDDNRYVHSLPPFANESNKALASKIREFEARLNQLNGQSEDNVTRAESMAQHMKNVNQELSHTQALYDAKSRQIETEEHLKQLAEREAGRLVIEIKSYNAETSDTTDHVVLIELNTLQNSIYRGNEKIETVRTELKLEAEELQEWLRVQSEKDEDNLALLKYTKEDDSKIKELSLSIEKVMGEVSKKKSILSAEVTETQVAQLELDKTTEAFKDLHRDRQELISQWEAAIKNMQKRDGDITEAQEHYQQQKEEVRKAQEAIRERQEFLEQQLGMNGETEKSISICERTVAKSREQQTEMVTGLQQYRDEVEVIRNTLNKSAAELVNKKSELTNLKGDLQDRITKLDGERKGYEEMKQKLFRLDDDTMTLEAKSTQLQEMLREEELKDKELDREIKTIRDLQFKKSQELFKLRQDEKNLSAEITGGEASLKNLKAKVHRLDQDALKQRSMIYSMDFQVQQLERKLRRAQGDRSDEEKDVLLKQIEELNKLYEAEVAKWALLTSQLKRSQEDLRHAKRHLTNLSKVKDVFQTSIEELSMYNESAAHQLEVKVREKEEVMVEENILRLELKRLRTFLNARADEVFTLESRQVQLELGIQERTKEIDIHKDMLRMQIKNAEEERHSASGELRERVGKVEKLKKRYEILMTQFAPEEGEEDHSQAFYVIKAAQKREELQREGDELDANIRRAEKEIKALENTLKLMNDRNESFRHNLYRAELDSNDLQNREMLEAEYRQAMVNYKSKREAIQDLQQQLQQMEMDLATVSNEEAGKLQSVRILETKVQTLEREINEQVVKRDRAVKLIEKNAKTLRASKQSSDMTPEETDFAIRQKKEIGTVVLTELNKMKLKYTELSAPLSNLLVELDISPPSRALSRVSSRAGSVRDDMSESGSVRGSLNQLQNIRRSFQIPRTGSKPSLPEPELPKTEAEGLPPRPKERVVSGASTPQQTAGTPKAMSTTNINEMVDLPKESNSRSSSSVNLPKSKPSSSKARGPMTGSGRIKQPARPGSASSSSSHGSRQ